MHILILTTGSPSTCPRVLREARTLCEGGYTVSIGFSHWASWASAYDKVILDEAPWTGFWVGGSPELGHTRYAWTRLRSRIARFWADESLYAHRTGPDLRDLARRLQPDLIVAHNLGALAAALAVHHSDGIPFAFDAEDYHRGQHLEGSSGWGIAANLEDAAIPLCSALWTASPCITDLYRAHYEKDDAFTVTNAPYADEMMKPEPLDGSKIRLAWFSQTVGRGRGIEAVIHALKSLGTPASMLIIGDHLHDGGLSQNLVETCSGSNLALEFFGTVPPCKIPEMLAGVHVGLAVEIDSAVNRQVCQTNKIYSYLGSGCLILANATSGQIAFQQKTKSAVSFIDPAQIDTIAAKLSNLTRDPQEMNRVRMANFEAAQRNSYGNVNSSAILERIGAIASA